MQRRVLGGVFGTAAAGGWVVRHATSPAVRAWTPGGGDRRRAGPLAVRVLGQHHERACVLLHGITGSGDWWGSDYDGLASRYRVVIPDLLGFGASMDRNRNDFSLSAHCDALDAMATALGLDEAPMVVVGHSMGSIVALEWAARRDQVEAVVACNAPLYDSADEARAHIARMGPLEALLAMESPLAHGVCQLMCDLRWIAQWVAVAISPQWPVRIARQGVLHDWRSYLGGMNGIVLRFTWRSALDRLAAAAVPVVLVSGGRDPVTVSGRDATLARLHATVTMRVHPEAAHDLPVAHAQWLLPLLDQPSR